MTMVLAPKTTVSILPATTTVPNVEQKILLVGQVGIGGTGVINQLYENIQTPPEVDGSFPPLAPESIFGEDSDIAVMVRAVRETNDITRIDAIAVAIDPTAAAVASFTIIGPATSAGIMTIQIGSSSNQYNIPISDTATGAAIADGIASIITIDPGTLVTAVATAGNLVITAKGGGLHSASAVQFRVTELTASGISFDDVTLSGPSLNSVRTLEPVFDVIGNERYQTIVFAFPEGLLSTTASNISNFLNSTWNVDNGIQDTMLFTGYPYDHSFSNPGIGFADDVNYQQVAFFTDLGPAFNDVDGLTGPIDVGYSVFEYTPILLSKLAGIRALRLTPGAIISQFVNSSNGPLDAFGGPALASKPYFNTPLPGITTITGTDYGFDASEKIDLEAAGGFTAGLNVAGTEVILANIPTTYKTDAAGNPDISFKYVNYVDTISNIREYFFNNLKARFAQSRLTTGDLVQGRDMASQVNIESFCAILYQDLSGPDFVLVEAGAVPVAFFKTNLVVVIDKANGIARLTMKVPIVTQLRRIIATMQIAFSTEG